MIGKELYYRRDLVVINRVAVAIALLALPYLFTHMHNGQGAIVIISIVLGVIFLLAKEMQIKKPLVIVNDDSIVINKHGSRAIRYRDIQSVTKINRSILEITSRGNDGENKKVLMLLTEIEKDQREPLFTFLIDKIASSNIQNATS